MSRVDPRQRLRRAERQSYKALGFTTLPPDWVCEVLSPSTRALDRGLKLKVYAEYGVQRVWLVEPLEQLVEVLRLDGGSYRIVQTATGDAEVRLEPFDALLLPLSALWER